MKRKEWDARRRNRNIGTSKNGYGQDNCFEIPFSWHDFRLFYEKLNNPVSLTREINGNSLKFLIEPTRSGFYHACTPEEIERILQLIPSEDLAPIKMVILRQPKKKEYLLNPVWGRLHHWSKHVDYSGPVVYLEAQPIPDTRKCKKSLTPDECLELNELERDGHHVSCDRRYYYITGHLEAVRRTQLYRTLPHEIGHSVDYWKNVEIPAGEDFQKWKQLDKLYHSKPTKEREDFANYYAAEFMKEQIRLDNLPFDRLCDRDILVQEKLNPEWFRHNDL